MHESTIQLETYHGFLNRVYPITDFDEKLLNIAITQAIFVQNCHVFLLSLSLSLSNIKVQYTSPTTLQH